MKEMASSSRFKKHRSIELIPEFRSHLERTGMTFKEWQQRNISAIMGDELGESLRLRMRALQAKYKR